MTERKCIKCGREIGPHPCLCSMHLRELERLCRKLPEFHLDIRRLYSSGKPISKILDKIRARMFKLTLALGELEDEEKQKD